MTARQFELGSQYEIIEREGDGLGLAFRGIYEFALQNGSPDEILFGPLAKYVRGRNSATINTFFIGQVGNNVEIDSLEMKVNWRLKHEFSETFALGVEGYSDDRGPLSRRHVRRAEAPRSARSPISSSKDLLPKWEFAGGALLACRTPRQTSPSSSTVI